MENLEWNIQLAKVTDLKGWEKNPRKITEASFEKLKERIKARGMHDVFKVDTDGTILSGNQRKQALIDLGIENVYTLVPNRALTEEERDSVALESNRNDGSWDYDMLANSFDDSLLLDVGFTKFEMGMVAAEEKGGGSEELPAAEKEKLEQVTFTLASGQAATVRMALEAIEPDISLDNFGNSDKQGNTLYQIAIYWLEQSK